MPVVELRVRDRFEAGHYLPGHHKCGRQHGHSYKVEITVRAKVGKNGIGVNFGTLKDILRRWIIAVLDHHNLNDFFEIPTAENIAIWIFRRLNKLLTVKGKSELVNVTVWETENCGVTYPG